MTKTMERVTVSCSCGNVAIALTGPPMGALVCYCDTCQDGSSRIEALPGAHAVKDPDGGTAYVLYRKDRMTYERGRDLLRDVTLDANPATKRVYAACCNSAMLMRFDDVRHWVPVYRARFGAQAPALEMRICTSFAPDPGAIPNDVPAHPNYPGALAWKLLSSKIAMLLRR